MNFCIHFFGRNGLKLLISGDVENDNNDAKIGYEYEIRDFFQKLRYIA